MAPIFSSPDVHQLSHVEMTRLTAPTLPPAAVPCAKEQPGGFPGIFVDTPNCKSMMPSSPVLLPLSEVFRGVQYHPVYCTVPTVSFAMPQAPVLFSETQQSPQADAWYPSSPNNLIPSSPLGNRELNRASNPFLVPQSTSHVQKVGPRGGSKSGFKPGPKPGPKPAPKKRRGRPPKRRPTTPPALLVTPVHHIATPPAAGSPGTVPIGRTSRKVYTEPTELESNTKRGANTRANPGCWTCKVRRKLCDRGKPSCEVCSHLGLQCDGYSPTKPVYMSHPVANQRRREELAEIVRSHREKLGLVLPFRRKTIS